MSPRVGVLIRKPTASGSVCLAWVVVMLRLCMLNCVPGLASMMFSGICWWYLEIAGSACSLPYSTLCAVASVPRFFVVPWVMASMSISASL